LNAQFLAAIQLIVYAGAVVILFVFVIMLLGPDAGVQSSHGAKAQIARTLSGALLLAMGGAVIALLTVGSTAEPLKFRDVGPEHGSVEAVGRTIFTEGLVPFELATVLLIVAVVGAIAVARSRPGKATGKTVEHETKRLFHGPLHPRDAGRPLGKGVWESEGGTP
jgi:NADH-quinone oxidoreductase subunit J